MCRKEFCIPRGGLVELPSNFFIEQLLECDRHETDKGVPGKDVCDICGDGNECSEGERLLATRYCVDCEQNLCDSCSKRHGKQRCSRSHKIVTLEEKPSSYYHAIRGGCFCLQHEDELLKLYCFDCKKAVCVKCLSVEHNCHNCQDLNIASEMFAKDLQDNKCRLSECIDSTYAECELLNLNKEEVLQHIKMTEEVLEEQYKLVCAMVNADHQDLIQQLQVFKTKWQMQVIARTENLEKHITTMKSFKTYSEELLNKGTMIDISNLSKDLLERGKELVNLHVLFEKGSLEPVQVTLAKSDVSDIACGDTTLLGHINYGR